MAPAALLPAACLACTLAMFGTGLSDLRQMFTTKSVENIQFLPFLTTDVKYSGWRPGGDVAVGDSRAPRPCQRAPVPFAPQQPELAGLRRPEAGLDAHRRQHRGGHAADPLHPGVSLLQPRQAPGAAAEPVAPGRAGRRLRLLHPPDRGRADAPGALGAVLQCLHHQHVPVAAGRPGQDRSEQVDALPVLPADRHHLPGLHQLDALRLAAPRPLHHGPQRAGDCHQRRAVLAFLAVPAGAGQALPSPARLRGPQDPREQAPALTD